MHPGRTVARILVVWMCVACAMQAPRSSFAASSSSMKPPLVIGHRGASGYRPEHTLAAYELAIEQGADFIEPDLVITRDGVLVARHENEIGGTTDVATHPEFANRRTTKTIDGQTLTGWFTEDFTLAELRTLRARERIPQVRPANTRYDGQLEILTFVEIIAFVKATNARRAQAALEKDEPAHPVGLYPETKHPTYFRTLGLPLEEPLVASLRKEGYDDERAPVIIQSFETGNLRRLKSLTRVRLVQLVDSGAPFDFVAAGDPRTYADLTTPAGLREIATYASGLGAAKELVIPRTPSGELGEPTSLVSDAHAAGLCVHAWTFRAENPFLPSNLRSGEERTGHGQLALEVKAYLDAGVDGIFTDHPDIAAQARDSSPVDYSRVGSSCESGINTALNSVQD